MKLAAIFSKFLYQHKELKLPGIGVFTLDPSVPIPDVTEKNTADFAQHIKFTQQPITAADDTFIDFIRTETGKIRPLAISDLESYLADGKILLNIGKPFQLEGIGSLIKMRDGKYEFTPGEPLLQRHESTSHETADTTAKTPSVFADDAQRQNNYRKLLIGAAVVAGIALVIWGGYSLSTRDSSGSAGADSVAVADQTQGSNANAILDSVQRLIDSTRNAMKATATVGTYKFVIERTASKGRALRRYNQLKEIGTTIKMDTKDSTSFSLYFVLPATPADTSRIKDSLRIWYGRRQVFVE